MENKKITAALIYDFDGTLSPGNMQEYDFIPAVGKSNAEFWEDSNVLAEQHDADPILTYMYKMLQEAKAKQLPLKRQLFVDSGRNIGLYPGVKEWFGRINRYAAERGIEMLHYVISSGLKEIIEGSSIAHEFKKIFACAFLYDANGDAYWPAVAVNYTTKTQFLYKINKGVESVSDSHEVNRYVPEAERVLPFRRMIYVGDGTTDIPCMRQVKFQGGHSIAVYDPSSQKGRTMSEELISQGRVSHTCPADYREGSKMDRVVKTIIDKIYTDHSLALLAHERDEEVGERLFSNATK